MYRVAKKYSDMFDQLSSTVALHKKSILSLPPPLKLQKDLVYFSVEVNLLWP